MRIDLVKHEQVIFNLHKKLSLKLFLFKKYIFQTQHYQVILVYLYFSEL